MPMQLRLLRQICQLREPSFSEDLAFFIKIMYLLSRWLGKWLRRWRGEMCGQHYLDLDQGECWTIIRDLRQARCLDSDGHLLDSLKKMDCLSFNSSSSLVLSVYLTVILILQCFSSCSFIS